MTVSHEVPAGPSSGSTTALVARYLAVRVCPRMRPADLRRGVCSRRARSGSRLLTVN
ncbi:hypothetical protein IL992_25840 [Microbispora sp. NEAU-D428]|uniref:hypothetical protein n=1 Tax=Microbispora sitophila TaxID=2771537 RepID=UPI00186916B6|nr:hypothetical protein [Microbispora sitophila]MBE3012590.1 hypothetical protein [Microbispora sitophila]